VASRDLADLLPVQRHGIWQEEDGFVIEHGERQTESEIQEL
jgi:hypothetical protein